MGALDFPTGGDAQTTPIRDLPRASVETSSADNAAPSDAISVQSTIAPDTFVDGIEGCYFKWRAGRVTPHWVPFFVPKSLHSK